MKKNFVFLWSLLCVACGSVIVPPNDFAYKEITTAEFTLASWQKDTDGKMPIKIYIEGDGHAFNSSGRVSSDPTPRGKTMRELAFGDRYDNVAYLARPCQFVKSVNCRQKYWSSARFSPEVIRASAKAIEDMAKGREIVLIGYSGGAQVAGLVAALYPQIKVKKIITIAGNLDHKEWMEYHKLPLLNESLNLADYKDKITGIEQIHYVGKNDDVIPPELAYKFVKSENQIRLVNKASHGSGWEEIYPLVWAEK